MAGLLWASKDVGSISTNNESLASSTVICHKGVCNPALGSTQSVSDLYEGTGSSACSEPLVSVLRTVLPGQQGIAVVIRLIKTKAPMAQQVIAVISLTAITD